MHLGIGGVQLLGLAQGYPENTRIAAFKYHVWKRGIVHDESVPFPPSPFGRGRRDSLIEAGAPGEGRAKREPARSASPREAQARAKRKRDSAQPQAIGRSLKRSLTKS